MRPLFILGTGGQARDVAEIAAALDYRPVLVAQTKNELESWQGDDEVALETDVVERRTEHFAIGIGDNRLRAKIASRHAGSLTFPTLIHPDASLGRGVREMLLKGSGSVLFPGVRVMGGCTIGNFCNVNLNATLSHDCALGDFVNVSPGANLAGNVAVEEGAWIGIGVAVNQGSDSTPRRLGAWSTIGSGAVVLRDVDANSTYVGVPAKRLGS